MADEKEPLPPLTDEERREAYYYYALAKSAEWDEVRLYVKAGEVQGKGIRMSEL